MKRLFETSHVLFIAQVFLVLMSLMPSLAWSQTHETQPIIAGERFTVHSDVLGEDRAVMVHKPSDYEGGSNLYPVVYLLDGDGHFLHTAGVIQFLADVNKMPRMLVVALPNTDRTRDLTPALSVPDERFPTAGGADRFLSFIADELMPVIDRQYRTAPFQVLIGHSFGGLFAIDALLTRPEVFDAYLAISPSLWWDDKALLPRAETFFTKEGDEPAGFLFMTMGNEGGAMLSGAWGLAGILEEHAPSSFKWHFDLMEEETHGSIPHRSTYKGFEALYESWNLPNPAEVYAEGGISAVDAHFEALSKRFGYEILTPESLVNTLGYQLIAQKKFEEAIELLKRNTLVYPHSVNVYDSLGDAYDAAEQFQDSRENYEKACRMGREANNPNTALYCNNLERMTKKIDAMQ